MSPPRLVLDTGVLVSALLLHHGPLVWLHHAWRSKTLRPLASRETVEELIRVLVYPRFKLADADQKDLLDDYLPWCETVNVPGKTKVPDCRDPLDRPFLELAATAEADALITGDRDLLALSDAFTIPILTPAAFKERFDGGPRKRG